MILARWGFCLAGCSEGVVVGIVVAGNALMGSAVFDMEFGLGCVGGCRRGFGWVEV